MSYTGSMNSPTNKSSADVITVTELNRQARSILEGGLGRLWIEGELSNLARPASGHLYFSLKDQTAQLRCAFFRQRQRMNTSNLANGDKVIVFGQVSIYEPRGDYQLIVEQVEAAGEGELRRRFEELKKRLADEGLFAAEVKRPLPALPRRIGVITSPSGAAIRDILSVLKRRFPAVPVVIYPVAVQGDAAAPEIVKAIATAGERDECDVLIVARGGGSLEDLWAFNEELVVRAIRGSRIPVVTGIGHEVDFTISDFASDLRAPTPSGAAELVVPDQAEWLRTFTATTARLIALSRRVLTDKAQTLDWLSRRLGRAGPADSVQRQRSRLIAVRERLILAARHDALQRRQRLGALSSKLLQASPALSVQRTMQRLADLRHDLLANGQRSIERLQLRLRLAARGLNSVSPLATLERGYAIVSDANTGRILTDATKAVKGEMISARLARGHITATITASSDKDKKA